MAGSSILSRSLIRWRAGEGYRIGLMNGSTAFDGDLLRPNSNSSLDFTYVGHRADGSILLAGNSGIFVLRGLELRPLFRFENTRQVPDNSHWNLDPNFVLELDGDRFLVCSHWEGVFLIEPQAGGGWGVSQVDDEIGSDMTF